MQKSPPASISKKAIILLTVFSVILLCLIGSLIIGSKTTSHSPDAPTEEQASSAFSISNPLDSAKAIKNNLLSAVNDIKNNDLDSARKKISSVSENIQTLQGYIDTALKIPLFKQQLLDIQALLNAADLATEEILFPVINLLEAHPIAELKVDDGLNVGLLYHYIDFAESVMPTVEILMQSANTIDFTLFDSEGKITPYLEMANGLLDTYHENRDIFSTLKSMVSPEESRLYLITVQNPSEIRASGGFPGFMSTARIENGILTLGDFESVSKFLSVHISPDIQITQEEYTLFNYLSGMNTPRDSGFCPDFERVGHIWGAAYESKHAEPVAGVISMSTHIVQRLLGAMNKEIVLSDEFTLTAENANKVLLHDIYFKYFSKPLHPQRLILSDALFALSAKKTMDTLMDNISVSNLLGFVPVFIESFEDRTLMLWMKDEAEQAFVSRMGWSGGLNQNPEEPEAGIFYNMISASKMGWFFLMDPQMGQRTKNEDGSYSYPITVTISNNITDEEIKAAGTYISAGLGGAIHGTAYFFAPAGGSVSDFSVSTGQEIQLHTYQNLQLGFMRPFLLYPNTPITITYTVTTAPGVEAPLVFSKMSIAQNP